MDYSHLRSKLQYYYPNNFQNLTINDLKECKWSLQLLIYQTFLKSINIFEDYFLKFEELTTKRLKQLQQIKTEKNIKNNEINIKEIKQQIEEEYKYHIRQIILQICIDYKYSLVLIPFSNPLQSLNEDINFILDTIVIPTSDIRPLQLSTTTTNTAHHLDTSTSFTSSSSSSIPPTPTNIIDRNKNDKPLLSSRKSPTSKLSRPSSRSNITLESQENEIQPHSQQLQQPLPQEIKKSFGDYQSLQQSFQVEFYTT